MPRVSAAAATAEIARRDPVMAGLIERAGPLRIRPPRDPDPFVDLAESIAYQQLAGRAAAAIWTRVAAMFDGGITPERVLATPDEAFRAAGFSGAKTRSVKDLADKVLTGVVPVDRLRRMRDDEIIERLSLVRGIGPWTAQMFLIFTLRRMDVWPVLDYGVRNGYRIAYRLPELPTPKALEAEGERFRPYRTVAAWYCWRAVELGAEEG
ncbi:MAG TPA: DNA-3-methyladenine glycosylase 2 family protein [Actinomycetota bacterium]|nr:DNA-3-methyladenine glycosylase 2 family protein [Actinomycetota bacterium]